MKKIHINYAYDGFLYAPLFLASEMGLFQGGMLPKPRGSDIDTIRALANKSEDCHNWFAICDPFATDISKIKSAIGADDEVMIVGVLIDRLPVWLHTSHPKLQMSHESDLKLYAQQIDKIRCYARYNTGYLIGKRIIEVGQFDPNKLEEVALGQEFLQPMTDHDRILTVTSDVLRVAEKIDSGNGEEFIFNYAGRCNELNPFLFTAVLTLSSVIDKHLDAVLSVLAGLRHAIDNLSNGYVHPQHVEILLKKFGPRIQSQNTRGILERSIDILFKEELVYSRAFDISKAKSAYGNARREWEKIVATEFFDLEERNDPIPSLLIKSGWRSGTETVRAFAQTWKIDNRLISIAADTWRNDAAAVAAVADSWRDEKNAISVVADRWMPHEKALAILQERIHPAGPGLVEGDAIVPDLMSLAVLVVAVVVNCIGLWLVVTNWESGKVLSILGVVVWLVQVGVTGWIVRALLHSSKDTKKTITKLLVEGVLLTFGLQIAIAHLADLSILVDYLRSHGMSR